MTSDLLIERGIPLPTVGYTQERPHLPATVFGEHQREFDQRLELKEPQQRLSLSISLPVSVPRCLSSSSIIVSVKDLLFLVCGAVAPSSSDKWEAERPMSMSASPGARCC